MIKSVFQGLFNAEVNKHYSMIMPVKQMLYDLSAWVHRAVFGEVETVTDNLTLTASDSGKTFLVGTDAKTITLPPTQAGVKYTFVNIGADGNNIITISPNASDAIYGTLTLADSIVKAAATDDKDLINTKATAVKGDSVTLVGDGGVGWAIVASTGIWAKQG